MNFKEWLELNEVRFKGLRRMFDKEHPDMPKYVKNDLYNNRVAFTMKRLMGDQGNVPTIGMGGSSGYNRTSSDKIPSDSASRIFNGASFKDHKFEQTPIIINVSPLDFNEKCLRIMMKRLFGYQPEKHIRDDEERSERQRDNVSSEPQEPIIVIKGKDGKYELLEGWHRTMASLVFDGDDNNGAPPHHIAMLKSGKFVPTEELGHWKKVALKAYIGSKHLSV
jgi:hypothetical protein